MEHLWLYLYNWHNKLEQAEQLLDSQWCLCTIKHLSVRAVFSDIVSYTFDMSLPTDILIYLLEEQFCRSCWFSNIHFKGIISSVPYSWPIHICSHYLFSATAATKITHVNSQKVVWHSVTTHTWSTPTPCKGMYKIICKVGVKFVQAKQTKEGNKLRSWSNYVTGGRWDNNII